MNIPLSRNQMVGAVALASLIPMVLARIFTYLCLTTRNDLEEGAFVAKYLMDHYGLVNGMILSMFITSLFVTVPLLLYICLKHYAVNKYGVDSEANLAVYVLTVVFIVVFTVMLYFDAGWDMLMFWSV